MSDAGGTRDVAARVCLFSCVMWLLVGALAFAVASFRLAAPDFVQSGFLSHARLRAVASIAIQYGWLGIGGMGATLYVLPRVTKTRIAGEGAALMSAVIVNTIVAFGVLLTLGSGISGPEFSEMHPALDFALVIALAMFAGSVIGTVIRNRESRTYVSLWHLCGAALWAPLAIIAGFVGGGGRGSIAWLFSINAVSLLWLGSASLGALYYILPRAADAPLFSHRLARIGFFSLALLAALAGASRQVLGPSQSWLQTLAGAAAIGLLIPAFTTLVNVFGTFRGSWSRLTSNPSGLALTLGSVFYALASLWLAVGSIRTVSMRYGTSLAIPAQLWTLFFGAFGLMIAGFVLFAFPRLMGHEWMSVSQINFHIWSTAVGVGAVAFGAIGSAAWLGGALETGARFEVPVSHSGRFQEIAVGATAFYAVAAFGALLVLAGALALATNLFRSASGFSATRPVEIVVLDQ